MGCGPIPPYVNLFMATRDKKILELSRNIPIQRMKSVKKFLDDIFSLWFGTSKDLHKLFKVMDSIHPSIKFTMKHTTSINELTEDKCDCETKNSIPFLDTSISIEDGKIIVDLYQKTTDKNQYLLPNSCHPPRQYGRSRQCGCPVGARCSMRFGQNRLIKYLI